MTDDKFKGFYFARPINSRKYHIFKEGRSVCGRWILIGKNEDLCIDVTGKETLGKEDCKSCFKKAGIEIK